MRYEKLMGLASLVVVWLSGAAVSNGQYPGADRTAVGADTLTTDPETGLAVDDRLTLVKAQCTGCHSARLIVQNRFTRDGWKEKIRWMQRTQNLWDLGEAEPVVLDYLVTHYGPQARLFDGRRLPLKGVTWYKLTNER